MPAPKNNRNAAKPRGQTNNTYLHVGCKLADKKNWLGAAGTKPLAKWVIEVLNQKAPPIRPAKK